MSAKRNISKASPVDGATFSADVADTSNALAGYLGGMAVNPAETNAYTFDLEISAGFSGFTDGFLFAIKIPNTNTGAVTFNPGGTGAKVAKKSNGDAFTGGELVAGTVHAFIFHEADDELKQLGSGGGSASANYPFLYVDVFDTAGADTWTAPWDCDALFRCIGGGGSGARNEGGSATGGAAGGHCWKFVANIAAAEEATVTVGDGGASVTGGSGTEDGNDGGTSSVSSTDFSISLSASGGAGGNADGTAAIGGSATGGDENHKGGDSGTASSQGASGGGAVGIFGEGTASADASAAISAGAVAVPASYPVSVPWLNTHGASSGQAFCGGAGDRSTVSGDDTVGGDGGTGAGGGGAQTDTGTGSSATSGAGGVGVIMVIYTADKSA